MPTAQLIAILKSSGPAQAVSLLLSMPAERMAVLSAMLEPAAIARMLVLAPGDRRAELLATVPAERVPLVLRELSTRRGAALLSLFPTEWVEQVLRSAPPDQAAELMSAMPQGVGSRLLESMELDSSDELASAVYEQAAMRSVARAAVQVSQLDDNACDLLAEVFGKRLRICVRYCATEAMLGFAVYHAATEVSWRGVAGIVIVTNVALTDDVALIVENARSLGRTLEVVRWADERDDGVFKRALVRLAG